MEDVEPLRTAVERATGASVASMSTVHGGDVASSFKVVLGDGRRLFAKTHASAPEGFFTTEALGLVWLAEANAVPVPTVIASSDGDTSSDGDDGDDGRPAFLALEWIEHGRPGAATDADFGATLVRLHDAGAPCFGREDGRTTSTRRLPNDPHGTWSSFYAECRLLPLARLAAESDALTSSTIARLVRLASSLERFDDGSPPARLHGDLWAGNRMIDVDGTSWLIDPAAHGGHREFDLAMMRLFGGFSPACFAAYGERSPMAVGWEDRVPLHQIAPLVVHAIKFAGSYVDAATSAINRY